MSGGSADRAVLLPNGEHVLDDPTSRVVVLGIHPRHLPTNVELLETSLILSKLSINTNPELITDDVIKVHNETKKTIIVVKGSRTHLYEHTIEIPLAIEHENGAKAHANPVNEDVATDLAEAFVKVPMATGGANQRSPCTNVKRATMDTFPQ